MFIIVVCLFFFNENYKPQDSPGGAVAKTPYF